MINPIALASLSTAARYALIISMFLIASCASQDQPAFTAQPINGEAGDLFYLGRDPDYKDRSLIRARNIELIVLDGVPSPAPDSMHLLNHTQINTGIQSALYC